MALTNRHILIVEDEYMLAQDFMMDLEDAGAIVVGPEPSLASALTRISEEGRIEAVVLDVNLDGDRISQRAEGAPTCSSCVLSPHQRSGQARCANFRPPRRRFLLK